MFWDNLYEKKNEYVYFYNWITLLFTWNQHNTVNPLSSTSTSLSHVWLFATGGL